MTAAEGSLSPGLRVFEVTSRESFADLRDDWNAVADLSGHPFFYRHEFFRIWLDNFAPRAKLRILVASFAGQPVGFLPLMEEGSFGPVKQLVSLSNPHSCRCDLLAVEPQPVASVFFDYLSASSSWQVVRIADVPQGGNGHWLLKRAKARGWPVGEWESQRSPFISLPDTIEALHARLDAKFKSNLRRRQKKLFERGPVIIERFEGGPRLAERLEEMFAVEASGWKGRGGTAIVQDAATRGFYADLSREASYRGWLSLYLMRLCGRLIAFQLGITHENRYLLLKTGYDERFGDCSPGQLLTSHVVEDCIHRKLSELDFLGPDMEWKREWTDQVRTHTWLYLFRRGRWGKAIRDAKFDWLPSAKRQVLRWTP
jgi:CelD/BcsL family acetyltransferase involved in cellulose biosynthesis